MDAPQTLEHASVDTPSADETSTTDTGAALGLMLLAAVVAFWPTVASFPPTWNASYQEQGFFVGGLVIWLLWRDRRRVVSEADDGIPDLLPVVGLLSVGWLFAVIMNVRIIHQLLFWTIATTVAFSIFGWRARRPILVTAATFLLAIPFWGVGIPVLQRMTTIMSGAMAKIGGVEAVIREDTISISTGTFLVESGCSGINYLMGGLVLGAFYAHLFTARWQTQLKIVAVAGAFSIVGNWIRVAVLVLLGEATAMQSPYIEDHLWQGWAIFTLLMIPTYFVARRIEERDAKLTSDARVASDSEVASDQEVTSDSLEGASDRVGAPMFRRARRVVIVAVLGPALYLVLGLLPRGDAVDRSSDVFGLVDGWTFVGAGSEAGWSPDFHGFDHIESWTVEGPTGSTQGIVEASRYYYADQRQGEELIQYNNQIAPDSLKAADRVIGPVGPQRRFVRETVVRDAEVPRVVWHWYRVAEFDTPFESKAKLLEILAFLRRTPAAELIVLNATCSPDDCTDAALALRAAVGLPTERTEGPARSTR